MPLGNFVIGDLRGLNKNGILEPQKLPTRAQLNVHCIQVEEKGQTSPLHVSSLGKILSARVDIAKLYASDQRSPTPGLCPTTGTWPVRNWATLVAGQHEHTQHDLHEWSAGVHT